MSCCCCDEYGTAADEQFTTERAEREVADYRAKGPGVTTRLLRDSLVASGPIDGSLLDIGAGVGALTFELLARGLTRATAVDASAAYVAAASQEAAQRGYSQAIHFVRDDFLRVAREIPPATIVTLDRVVCCYPTYETLLTEALCHAERYVGLSYPRDVIYVRIGNAVSNARRLVAGRNFRTFVHPAVHMEAIITNAGFERIARRRTLSWCVDLYRRSEMA